MEIEQQIQNEAQRVTAAFAGFKAVFEATNPPPVEKPLQQENVWIKAALLTVLVASVIVSGSHTIPTFADGDTLIKGIVGIAAFFMVEIAIVSLEFIRTQRHYRVAREEPASLGYFIVGGLIVAVAVALLANMEYMLSNHGILITDTLRLVILLGMALSAPLLAFLVGGILAMYAVMDRVALRRHRDAYAAEMQEWEESRRRAWNANKGRIGGVMNITVERPSAVSEERLLSTSTQADSRQSGAGYSRVSSAVDIARQWLADNPDKADMPVRQLADMIGVGKDSVAKARNELKG